ncbi:MAG: hypothetical protein KC442_13890 [Thermomicrobiales bacterium]|nr:hypothetical protein [Thermomicrobiales bacterium]
MRLHWKHPKACLTAVGFIATSALLAGHLSSQAQSQEPKPAPPPVAVATPLPQVEAGSPRTGVTGNTWLGPNFGVGITWDANIWVVESEQVERAYDGLRLGTPVSSVFVEAFEGFPADPVMCLEDANAEIAGREFVTEVVPLPNRPLPDTGSDEGVRQLFGIAAKLSDGTVYRGAEYVECRQLPGGAMMELTWQVPVEAFNAELPLVNDLFASLLVPGDGSEPPAPPELPELPIPPTPTDPAM